MEERLVKLEQILHKLFCCNSSQFQGPPGLQGEPGNDGAQGPQGPPGPVGPSGLNWQGEFVPCVVYQQDDAVGYNGASYYVTCETSDSIPCINYTATGTENANYKYIDCYGNLQDTDLGQYPENFCATQIMSHVGVTITPSGEDCPCMTPDHNPCFALLASQGAIGPAGPQGLTGTAGAKGIDGANSLRWIAGITNISGGANPNTFNFNTTSLAVLTTAILSVKESHGISVPAWLLNIASKSSPTSFVQVQITDSLDNSKFGTYNLTGLTNAGIPAVGSYLVLNLTPISGNGTIVTGKEYTISWNYSKQGIQGLTGPIGLTGNIGLQGPQGVPGIQGPPGPGSSLKTYGLIQTTSISPYPTFPYDFNDVRTLREGDGILLPVTTIIGTEIVAFSSLDNALFNVFTDNTEATPSIRTKNVDTITTRAVVYPGDTFRFVFLGNVADPKNPRGSEVPLWFCESINGIPYRYNNTDLGQQGFDIITTAQDLTLVPRSSAYLQTQYGSTRGVSVYCPNINKVYTNVGGGYWTQQTISTVL